MSKPLKIASFCSPFLLTVEREASLVDVMKIMEEADIRHIPVADDGTPVGIISERELKVFENREFAEKFTAEDIMIDKPYTATENTDLREVVEIMSEKKYGSCLIQDEYGKITGIFTMVDALRTLKILLEKSNQPINQTIDYN